jgi:transcriptional regulator with XRE-family HTH domain
MSDAELSPFGTLLRRWRRQRGTSQLRLAGDAGTSARHVSFIETGRSRPREGLVLRLADALDVPLRERNDLLRAAGLSPLYPERALADDELRPFRRIVEQLLMQQEPFPAIVIDRYWNVVDSNRAGKLFLGLGPGGDTPNAVELLLAPGGWREMLENFAEVAWGLAYRLRREAAEAGSDPELETLVRRAEAWLERVPRPVPDASDAIVCPRVRVGDQVLSTISTIARFGTARDVTIDELRVELMFPADDVTAAFFERAAG